MATLLVAHGGWSAGWAWKKMHPLLGARGHHLFTPTLTGLGERAHLANPHIDLETHIADILGVLNFEDLKDVVLIGHSYGGMVATGVADRARGRLRKLVYLDAFVPEHGQSLLDLVGPEVSEKFLAAARTEGQGWRVPPLPMPPDTPPEDVAWAQPKRVPQPIMTFQQKVDMRHGPLRLPRAYIFCTKVVPPHGFGRFYDMVEGKPGWTRHTIDASHNPHITTPNEFADLLETIIA